MRIGILRQGKTMFSLEKVTKISILFVGLFVFSPNIGMAQSERMREPVEKPKNEEMTKAVEKAKNEEMAKAVEKPQMTETVKKPKKKKILAKKSGGKKLRGKKQSKITCTKGCHTNPSVAYCSQCQHYPLDMGCGHFHNPCNLGYDPKTKAPFNSSELACTGKTTSKDHQGYHPPDPAYPKYPNGFTCVWIPKPCGPDPHCHLVR